MDSTTSDSALAVAIGRYDQDALAEAYNRHGGAVFALARRVIRSRELAEEVTQEIFLRLWHKPQRFDPERGKLRSFLLSDTHGRAIDMIRSEGARKTREEREAAIAPQPQESVEGSVWQNVASAEIRQALMELSSDERAAIELAYFGGLTYREVAERLGQPEGTVKSRIRTGMKRLKVQLSALGVMP
ncbi:MAG: sigma-70 family RNA polymerase sigma factor [Acidimicrobiia bacterium]|nr:sigma-70 family RNA polymerase sigma factor [Acidimicrobiia bacterium]